MKARTMISVEFVKLQTYFADIRETLLQLDHDKTRTKPLVFWALPGDRHLPAIFLNRSVGELLATPFEQLIATPGVGEKKIRSLLHLLGRAADSDRQEMAQLDPVALDDNLNGNGNRRVVTDLDPDTVSELEWAKWRQTIRKRKLIHHRLGQMAASLQTLPTVIWNTPLSAYLDYTIDEMRQLKTHGKKRVRAILGVFGHIHHLLAEVSSDSHLAIRLVPDFVLPVEAWVTTAVDRTDVTTEELRKAVTEPLIGQLRIDVRSLVSDLAELRLAVDHDQTWSVQTQAKRMGITRARIYQLLEECSRVMHVRWPEGRALIHQLNRSWQTADSPSPAKSALQAVCEVFFREDSPESNGREVKDEEPVSESV
jgi:hypothetical protein